MFTFFSITIRSFLIHTAARSWAQTSNWIPTEPWSHHHAVRLDYIKTQKSCTGSPRCSKMSSTLNKVQTETEIRLKPRLDHSHLGAGLDVIKHQSHLFSVLELFVSLVTETRTWWGGRKLTGRCPPTVWSPAWDFIFFLFSFIHWVFFGPTPSFSLHILLSLFCSTMSSPLHSFFSIFTYFLMFSCFNKFSVLHYEN